MKTICKKCGLSKSRSSFYKNKHKQNGLYSYCKTCHNKLNKSGYVSSRESIDALLSNCWSYIKSRHHLKGYENVKVLMSRDEFLDFMKNDKLKKLYNNWVKSNYQYNLVPSVDRIDPNGHYAIDNIRWLTQSQNASLGGKKPNRAKPIAQYHKDGTFIKEFSSAAEASRVLLGSEKGCYNISSCRNGKIPSAYGFVWKSIVK